MADTRTAVKSATDNEWFEKAARAGFAVSGVLHLLIAYIVLRLALGGPSPSGNADQSGALATLGSQTGGAVMLWIAAVGLVALGLWRLAETVLGGKPGEASGRQSDDNGAVNGSRPSRWRWSTSRWRSPRRGSPWAVASRRASGTPGPVRS